MPPAPPVDVSSALGALEEEEAPLEGEDEMFAPAAPEMDLGETSETDPVFASDVMSVFPELDDAQIATLQRLIDDRCMAMKGPGY